MGFEIQGIPLADPVDQQGAGSSEDEHALPRMSVRVGCPRCAPRGRAQPLAEEQRLDANNLGLFRLSTSLGPGK